MLRVINVLAPEQLTIGTHDPLCARIASSRLRGAGYQVRVEASSDDRHVDHYITRIHESLALFLEGEPMS